MKISPPDAVLLKAMDNAHEGITISDVNLPDNPLIYVNKGFLKMVGYSLEECLGHNCRYLQGPETDRDTVAQIRKALNAQESVQVELLNYRKNGQAFWNYLSLTPIFNERGQLTHYIGVQEDITEKKRLVHSKEELKRQQIVSETTLQAQEAERSEIGKELHDNVNQLIATLRLYLNMVKGGADNREEMLQYATELTDKLLGEVRQVSHRLVGPAFAEISLSDALRDLLAGLRRVVPFTIELAEDPGLDQKLNERQKLVLYRVIQEQLHNILKYAAASEVTIRISDENAAVQLSLRDDGVGFDPEVRGKGIGFRNIASRVELENGSFDVKSGTGQGCELMVSLPIIGIQPDE